MRDPEILAQWRMKYYDFCMTAGQNYSVGCHVMVGVLSTHTSLRGLCFCTAHAANMIFIFWAALFGTSVGFLGRLFHSLEQMNGCLVSFQTLTYRLFLPRPMIYKTINLHTPPKQKQKHHSMFLKLNASVEMFINNMCVKLTPASQTS